MDDQSIPIKSSGGKGGYYRSEGADKPSGKPKGGKDFKKIFQSEEGSSQTDADGLIEGRLEDNHEEEANLIALKYQGDPNVKPSIKSSTPTSPFALVSQSSPKKPELTQTTVGKDVSVDASSSPITKNADKLTTPIVKIGDNTDQTELAENESIEEQDKLMVANPKTPTDATAKIAQQPQQPAVQIPDKNDKVIFVKPEDTQIVLEKKETKADNFNNQFTREQPDFSYVNPLAVAAPQIPITAAEVKAEKAIQATNMQALVEKLVKELTVVQQGDKTETSLVLDNPPQFNGMRIVITQYASANNEFNLKFENLTQAAKEILDLQQNRSELMANLEKKGYNVHIFITTTYTEMVPLSSNVDTPSREREKEGKQGGKESSREREGKNGQAA